MSSVWKNVGVTMVCHKIKTEERKKKKLDVHVAEVPKDTDLFAVWNPGRLAPSMVC